MVGPTTMLVFGGRAGDGRVLSDAALLEAADMRWSLIEPTPFSRCAHTGVAVPSSTAPSTSSSIQGGLGCSRLKNLHLYHIMLDVTSEHATGFCNH
eukprot:295231-Pelagomonas_calceolata.AAC.4